MPKPCQESFLWWDAPPRVYIDVRPETGRLHWTDALRWLLVVMDDDDSSIGFVASCLGYAMRGGLTPKQGAACQQIFSRVSQTWNAGELSCQNTGNSQPCTVVDFDAARQQRNASAENEA